MAANPYDVKFTIGDKSYGFMLVTPKDESKQISFDEVGAPDAQRVSTNDIATHQDFDPKRDTPFAMSAFSSGAGQLEFEGDDEFAYWWADGIVTHVAGKAFLAPGYTERTLPAAIGRLSGFSSYVATSGTVYDFCWIGAKLYRRSSIEGDEAWTLAYTAGADITDFQVIDGAGYLLSPNDSVSYRRQADVTAALPWTPSTVSAAFFTAGNRPKFLVQVRSTTYALVDYNKVYLTVDPGSAGSWTGPIELTVGAISKPATGGTTYPFVGGLSVNDYLIAFKQDTGMNIDDQQNIYEAIWGLAQRVSPENFEHLSIAQGNMFYSAPGEVFVYDPGTGLTPSMELGKRDGFAVKKILGLAADEDFAYVMFRGSVPNIADDMVAIIRTHKDGRAYAVEVLYTDMDNYNGNLDTYNRLWASPAAGATTLYAGHGPKVIEFKLPHEWDTSAAGGYRETGVLYTSIARSGFPGFVKRHLWIGGEAEGVDEGNTIVVAYSTDYGKTFTDLGAIDDDPLTYDNVNAKSIVLRFTFTSEDGSRTPALRAFDHHQRVRFRYLPAAVMGLRVADKIELNNRSRDDRKVPELRADLEAVRTADEKVFYEDFMGNAFYVSCDVLAYRPTRHEAPDNKYEMEATITVSRADRGV